jgi:hypothetical protein
MLKLTNNVATREDCSALIKPGFTLINDKEATLYQELLSTFKDFIPMTLQSKRTYAVLY